MALLHKALPGLHSSRPQHTLYTAVAFSVPEVRRAGPRGRWQTLRQGAYKVDIETSSGLETITVEEGNTILQTALDQGIELSHDCKMGVCMTCPAKLVSTPLHTCSSHDVPESAHKELLPSQITGARIDIVV